MNRFKLYRRLRGGFWYKLSSGRWCELDAWGMKFLTTDQQNNVINNLNLIYDECEDYRK